MYDMSDLQFLGTAEGLGGEKIAVFQECGETFRLDQKSLESRIRNLTANGSAVSPAEMQALEMLRKEDGSRERSTTE